MEPRIELRREAGPDIEAVGQDDALVERIRAEIAATGPMTFARFMDLALYDPDGGYYRSDAARPGRGGDFLTAPEAHPIFGAALARALDEVWIRLGRPDRFVVREHGAGEGALAEGILSGLANSGSGLATAIRYQPIEIDPRRLESFRDRLADAGFGDVAEPADDGPIVGCVLANEVLDALPVHRVGVRGGELRERFVDLLEDALGDAWGPPSSPALAARLDAAGIALAEGQSAEVCLALDDWIRVAAAGLDRGLMLLIDYGAPAVDLYDPTRRRDGTLRAYLRHTVHDDPYAHIGRQDLTAHVDITATERAAHAAGLTTVGMTTQAEFLVGVGTEDLLRSIQTDPATTMAGYLEVRSALMRMLDPAAMGRFRVMAFGRDWPVGPPLAGLAYRVG
jgi:SAM-dependent MidA family methyltransferase